MADVPALGHAQFLDQRGERTVVRYYNRILNFLQLKEFKAITKFDDQVEEANGSSSFLIASLSTRSKE